MTKKKDSAEKAILNREKHTFAFGESIVARYGLC